MPGLTELSETRSEIEIDRFPVADLPSRYGIKSAALYKRFKAADVTPTKSSRKSFLSGSQLKVMDDLHKHLERSGGLSDFAKPDQVPDSTGEDFDRGSGLVSQRSSGEIESAENSLFKPKTATGLLEYIIELDVGELLTSVLVNAGKILFPPPLPAARRGLQLAYLRELEEATEKGWLLTTNDVASLLGVSNSTIASKGQQFNNAGFAFSRAGKCMGGQIAWRVNKDDDGAIQSI